MWPGQVPQLTSQEGREPDSGWNVRLRWAFAVGSVWIWKDQKSQFVWSWQVWEELGIPLSAELVELFCIPYRLISDQISGEEWASTRVDCGTKAEAILISSQPSPHWGPSVSIHVVCWSKWKYSQSSFIPILGQSYELLITSLLLKPWQPCALLFQLSANLDF